MMNSSSSSAEFDDQTMKLKKELECSICFNIFEDPRQLACGHVFCGDCAHPMIESANNATMKTIKCPLCRRETEVSDGKLPMAIIVKSEEFSFICLNVKHIKDLIEHFKEGPFKMKYEAKKLTEYGDGDGAESGFSSFIRLFNQDSILD